MLALGVRGFVEFPPHPTPLPRGMGGWGRCGQMRPHEGACTWSEGGAWMVRGVWGLGRYGETPLHKAILFGHAEIVDTLLSAVSAPAWSALVEWSNTGQIPIKYRSNTGQRPVKPPPRRGMLFGGRQRPHTPLLFGGLGDSKARGTQKEPWRDP